MVRKQSHESMMPPSKGRNSRPVSIILLAKRFMPTNDIAIRQKRSAFTVVNIETRSDFAFCTNASLFFRGGYQGDTCELSRPV
jgi:hypothetical protein